MKLASYRDGSRDGQLIVVSRDLRTAAFATHCATRLQQVLDDWNFLSPQLELIYRALNQGQQRHSFEFDPRQCMAPLPRPTAWLDAEAGPGTGSAAPLGGLRLRAECAAALGPCEAWTTSPGGGDALRPAVGALTGDVPAGASRDAALEGVRLLMLILRVQALPQNEEAAAQDTTASGNAWQSRRASWFSPVAITPDEWGGAWQAGQLRRPLRIHRTGTTGPRGEATALELSGDRLPSFGDLLHLASLARGLSAGSLVCSGAQPGADEASWLARQGDALALDMPDVQGFSAFGRIEAVLQTPGQRS
jgi:fumarylacetoacetate (FAA) hydrolase